MKMETSSHVKEVGVVFFTQDFSNKNIYFACLIFSQIHNNFYFHEVFLKNVLRVSSKKITD